MEIEPIRNFLCSNPDQLRAFSKDPSAFTIINEVGTEIRRELRNFQNQMREGDFRESSAFLNVLPGELASKYRTKGSEGKKRTSRLVLNGNTPLPTTYDPQAEMYFRNYFRGIARSALNLIQGNAINSGEALTLSTVDIKKVLQNLIEEADQIDMFFSTTGIDAKDLYARTDFVTNSLTYFGSNRLKTYTTIGPNTEELKNVIQKIKAFPRNKFLRERKVRKF